MNSSSSFSMNLLSSSYAALDSSCGTEGSACWSSLLFFQLCRSLRKSSISRMKLLLSAVAVDALTIYSSSMTFSRWKSSSSYRRVIKFLFLVSSSSSSTGGSSPLASSLLSPWSLSSSGRPSYSRYLICMILCANSASFVFENIPLFLDAFI